MNDLIMRIAFLKAMCVVTCSKAFVFVDDIKVKTFFDNEIEINCINKKLTNERDLSIRHETIMFMIVIIENNVKFVDIYDDFEIRLRNATIIVFIFIVIKSNHFLILKRFFERFVKMSNTNMNDDFLELIIHSNNKSTRVFF